MTGDFVEADGYSAISVAGYRWTRWPAPYADSRMLISIGRDMDGTNLVVGRAMHHGDMLPAKVKPDHGVAYVCYGGVEHTKHDFEVYDPPRDKPREIRLTVPLIKLNVEFCDNSETQIYRHASLYHNYVKRIECACNRYFDSLGNFNQFAIV